VEYLPCGKRLKLIAFRADGQKDNVFRCAEPTAEQFGKDVTPEVCAECPVRRGTIQPAAKFDKSKAAAVKQDTKGGDGFPPCADRLVAVIKACCGNTIERRVCDSLDSSKLGAEVTPVICAQCPARRFFS
jgi:hypothetical protein